MLVPPPGTSLTPAVVFLAAATMLSACGDETGQSNGGGPAISLPTPTPSPSPSPSPSPAPMPASQAVAQIGPCVNMANHLEAPNEGDWGRPIADDDFEQIAAVGFETIRLPVRWSSHANQAPPYAVDPSFMDRVDKVVGLARASGLRVILNMHHYDELFVDPNGERERFAEIWRQIAAHFATADEMVWFELINEPHDALNDSNLSATIEPALAAVRATNPSRWVVVGGKNYSNVDSLASLPLPVDDRIIATFHYYDPYQFTHQGADFLTNPPPTGRDFPSGNDQARLRSDVANVEAFIAGRRVPVFMGEYGAYDGIALDQRATYYKAVHDAFEAVNVDGCVWGYTNSFAFRVGNTWQQSLLRAIGL